MTSNDKPLFSTTVEEFVEALRTGLGLGLNNEDAMVSNEPKKHYVAGLAGLSKLLQCSYSTAARIHRSGTLAVATRKTGRILLFDADLVMDLLKVKKRK